MDFGWKEKTWIGDGGKVGYYYGFGGGFGMNFFFLIFLESIEINRSE